MDTSNWITALFAGGSAVMCALALEIFKSKIVKKNGDTINKVLFYEDEDSKDKCESVKTVLRIICEAKYSIDVCVPRLNDTIKKCLLIKQSNGINIRVIAYNRDSYDDLFPLIEGGIVVKVNESLPRMEYEFIIVDGDDHNGIVVAGSLDHDSEQMIGARRYVLLTSDKTAVKNFNNEFNRVWHTVAVMSEK